jgi:putative Mg2+ transporter-C (MgtC) family protein
MTEFLEEFTRPTWLSFPVVAARLLMALILGGAIGFEREWRNRPAGLRTHILLCVAAATFGILTIEIVHAPVFARPGAAFDPLRAVEAVTAGAAFLAAGTILYARGKVQGLTTGAGLWLAGAVGLCCGFGLWLVATLGAILALLVQGAMLTLMPPTKIDDGKSGNEKNGADSSKKS